MFRSPALDLRDRFVGFAFAAADLLAEVGPDGRIVFATGAFRERFGQDAEQFTGRLFHDLIAPEDRSGLEIGLSLLAARGRLTPIGLRLNTPERPEVALSGLRLPHRSGVAWLTMARMPSTPPNDAAALADMPLFREALAVRLLAEQPCDVGLVEVAGWSRLPAAARQDMQADIATAMRDAGGSGALAAEMGNGRFGLMATAAIDMKDLQARIARILQAGGAGRPVAGARIPLTLDGVGAAQAIRAMRFALTCFAARGAHSVRAAGFTNGLRAFLDLTEAQAGAVRAAIERGRFRLLFQPVVALADRRIHHFEALLRPYPVAGREAETTQEFVAFVEAMGMADLLDAAVLQRLAETLAVTHTRIAMNISGLSMQNAAFRANLLDHIDHDSGLCDWLMVELTETADIDDVAAAVQTVNRLAARGIPVCLDDFGAGYTAFRYLKEFKVDYVKIDGSYVHSPRASAPGSGFVGAMVDLARCVGARAIAEMVETDEQAERMAGLGVQFGQGWLFGRPGALPGTV